MTQGNNVHNKDPAEKIRQLKGFIPTTIFYFLFMVWFETYGKDLPLWVMVVAKILPILILIRFVLRQNNGSIPVTMSCDFCKFVMLGLCFSLVGDSLLVYQDVSTIFFLAGLVSFGVAHALYVLAFGWTPFSAGVLAKFTLIALVAYGFLWQGGVKDEPTALKIGVAVYCALNGAMNWRSWARLSFQDFRDGRWYEFFGCIGAINFLISDLLLAVNKFVTPLPYEEYLIMGTYYMAQLGLALCVVDGPDTYSPKEKRNQ